MCRTSNDGETVSKLHFGARYWVVALDGTIAM